MPGGRPPRPGGGRPPSFIPTGQQKQDAARHHTVRAVRPDSRHLDQRQKATHPETVTAEQRVLLVPATPRQSLVEHEPDAAIFRQLVNNHLITEARDDGYESHSLTIDFDMTRSPDDDRGWRPPPDEGQAGVGLLPNGWWGYRHKAGVRPLMVEKPEEREDRKLLTRNNIQEHSERAPQHPHPDPAPPHTHHTTETRTPRRHPNNHPGDMPSPQVNL